MRRGTPRPRNYQYGTGYRIRPSRAVNVERDGSQRPHGPATRSVSWWVLVGCRSSPQDGWWSSSSSAVDPASFDGDSKAPSRQAVMDHDSSNTEPEAHASGSVLLDMTPHEPFVVS